MQSRHLLVSSALVLATFAAIPAHGAVVAYWSFENGTAGQPVPHSTADGVFDPTTPDLSGNGNALSAFNNSWAGFKYTSITPYPTVPLTGLPNTLAVQNIDGFPALSTSPTSTASGIDARTITPAAFTVEASYKPENTNGWRTVVGRDANRIATSGDGNVAALYLQITPQNAARIQYVDLAGNIHVAATPDGTITNGFVYNTDNAGATGQFYNLAGVSDGTTLKIYVNGVLLGSTDMTGTSANTALNNGLAGLTGSDWSPGEWTVGRGLYNGAHGDRAYGLIDEVRISDTALAPSQFLIAAPEPATLGLAACGMTAFAARRRRPAR